MSLFNFGEDKGDFVLLTQEGPLFYDTEDEMRDAAVAFIEDCRADEDTYDEESVQQICLCQVIARPSKAHELDGKIIEGYFADYVLVDVPKSD